MKGSAESTRHAVADKRLKCNHMKKPQLERNHAFLKRYLILIDDILLLEFGSSILMTHYVFEYINYIINNLYHYNILWFNPFKTVLDR